MAWTKHTDQNKTALIATLPDAAAILAMAEQPAAPGFVGDKASRAAANINWYGTPTFEAAVSLARTGWPAGREAFVRDLAAIPAPRTGHGALYGHDVGGGFPDVGRAVAGDPMCMVTPTVDPTARGKVVTLRVWTAVSSMTDADTIRAWGAAICSHVDALEAAGWRVDLWQVDGSVKVGWSDHPPLMFVQHRVKEASQPADLDAIAFSFSHPSWARRIMFAVKETCPDTAKALVTGSYGVPQYSAEFEPGRPLHWAADLCAVPGVPAGMCIDLPGANHARPGETAAHHAKVIAELIKTGMEKTGAFDDGTGAGDMSKALGL